MHRSQNHWNANTTNDSGSESAPLLSSGSHVSIEPIMFQDSETSDLDMNLSNSCSRYGSVENNSCRSNKTVLPKRQPPLLIDNELISPSTFGHTPTLAVMQNSCYEIRNTHLVLDNDKYGPASSQPLISQISKQLMWDNYSAEEDTVKVSNRDDKSKQGSLVTVFSVWNTILGSSLLTMPWGITMAGFFPGVFLILAMSGLCLYTAHCLLTVYKYHGVHRGIEVVELSRIFLNKWADYIARIFSITVLLGAIITYWILMSNFLYNSVNFVYDSIIGAYQHSAANNSSDANNVLCSSKALYGNVSVSAETPFDALGPAWDLYKTVPIILGILIFPLLNFNSPTFFTKFNSLGTISVLYLMIFVIIKSATWGINMDKAEWKTGWHLKSTFPALSGMLALSYFIHNIIITIMQNNRDQSKNGRDLSIAYFLVTLTYIIVGILFYVSFPLNKSCIEDNFLNNFQKWDGLTVGARILLLFQLVTVYPLLAYMLRIQFLPTTYKTFHKSWVILVNVILMSICILFAIFVPYIGTIVRYTGALSGLIYVFTLPSLLYLAILKKQEKLNLFNILLHISIPIIGCFNLIAQFLITDK